MKQKIVMIIECEAVWRI